MKRIFVFLLAAIIGLAGVGLADEIRLTWDPNEPAPEGYRVFRRSDGAAYDYSQPFWQGPEVMTPMLDLGSPAVPKPLSVTFEAITWDKAAKTIFVDWNQPKSEATQVDFFVVRAYEGDLESADSEEVSWTQSVEAVVARWEVFFGESADGPWIPLDAVAAEDSTRITAPFTYVEPGETKEIFFTVVSFGEDGQFSPNATATSVVIDRPGPPAPPSGIKIQLAIPVQ
jgi:hypothetical protein